MSKLDADWKRLQNEYEKKAREASLRQGDFVKITGKRNFMDNGWSVHWSEVFMTPLIGRTGKVVKFSGSAGYEIEFNNTQSWNFPYEVLERVNNKVIGAIEYGN